MNSNKKPNTTSETNDSTIQIGEDDDSLINEALPNLEQYVEKKWRLSYLKSQFESLEIHHLFREYTAKINYGYFSLYLILQCILSLTHFFVLLFSTYKVEADLITVIPDITLYLIVCVLAVAGLVYIDKLEESNKKWQYLTLVAFGVLFFVNFFVPLYHGNIVLDGRYTPAYTVLLIISCYVFFGIRDNLVAFIMGFFVSIVHFVVLTVATYKDVDMLWERIFSDAIFICCINGLGLYFRYMNEIVKRRSFLDRRDCVVSMFQLQHEKDQEEQLMSSIIPSTLVSKVRDKYLKNKEYFIKYKRYPKQNPFDTSLLDKHEDVTILFADIVHYTEMTIKLNISDLLDTLNELFGRFDDASEELKVVRIKFLGDCYYCVAGLPPNPPPNHAEACVDLGLKMINIIADVRRKRNLNINMRIGIHTGNIIGGILGAVKYQFDIWSKDVDIANKMETEGCPGKVHITRQTLEGLKKPYDITSTDKGQTVPYFKQNNIETFLISPHNYSKTRQNSRDSKDEDSPRYKRNGTSNTFLSHLQTTIPDILEDIVEENGSLPRTNGNSNEPKTSTNGRRTTIYKQKVSNRNRVSEDRRITEERRITADMKRRTAFMNNNIKRYTERSAAVNRRMEDTIKNMSFSKREQYTKVKEINSLLCFRKLNEEIKYLKLADPLFRYYVLSQAVLVFCVYLIQNIAVNRWNWSSWPFFVTEVIILFILIPLTWTQSIWIRYVAKYTDREPSNPIVKFFFKSSRYITKSYLTRIAIYTLVFILFSMCVITEVIECEQQWVERNELSIVHRFLLAFIRLFRDSDATSDYPCVVPWHMTETCALAIIMTFVFLRIFIYLKLLFTIAVTAIYSYLVINYSKGFYRASETFNYGMDPQIAHLLSVIFLAFTLHVIDRQTDYMNRLDYLWNETLLKDQAEANEQQLVNKNLLVNILPKHVAKIYLDINREMNDLYHEDHNDVAVMFASIIFDDNIQELIGETRFLATMNTFVTEFDTLINRKEFNSVEKIKIAKWTYMAACGLVPGGKQNEVERHATSATLETLLNFVSSMYKKFHELNRASPCCDLRIGICHGQIVAGVVGSKKPLYDIWGDPVNMASRMDTTGVSGKIQVMEKTARIIENIGYLCEYRGEITVKGKDGPVKTYFVVLDNKYDLVRRKNVTEE